MEQQTRFAIDWIKDHPLETFVASFVVASAIPVVVRAATKPDRGSWLDRMLSRFEAFLLDVRKFAKTFGVALPGGTVDELPPQQRTTDPPEASK